MSVEWVRARCRCDRCMAWFELDIDTAGEVAPGWSVFDMVEDAIRGGHVTNSQQSNVKPTSIVKVEDYNEMLCGACTAIEDAKEDARTISS